MCTASRTESDIVCTCKILISDSVKNVVQDESGIV